MSTPALSLRAVTKNFGGLRAVSDVSLEVAPGERRVIIGPNGAGKTSLFHCISGVIQPSSGVIECFGEDITHLPEIPRYLDILCQHQTVDDLADSGLTIGYEILTHLGARYSRRYIEGGA